MRLVSHPVKRLCGQVCVPGDKSVSHRAAMLGAVANGTTEVSGFLNSVDCRATLSAVQNLGVETEAEWNNTSGRLRIQGSGGQFKAPPGEIDLGNSGTALRLMSGLLCGQSFATVLNGDDSLCRRPMRRIAEPLALMGADVRTESDGTPPLRIYPVPRLHCIDYTMPVASAQLKSCILLASLFAEGTTVVTEAAVTRDHTERMLKAFGAPLSAVSGRIEFDGGASLSGVRLEVPGDLSAAAFLIVAACLVEHSDVLIRNVGVNPTRSGVIDILMMMGADIEMADWRTLGGEPVADLRVRSSRLHGVCVPRELVANAIDEFPVLFIAAACADGVTELSDAAELRFKESDRIQAMADGLAACGIDVEARSDGLAVQGGAIKGGRVDSCGDHRIAMSFAVAGGVSERGIAVDDCSNIQTSFPDFVAVARSVGLDMEQSDE